MDGMTSKPATIERRDRLRPPRRRDPGRRGGVPGRSDCDAIASRRAGAPRSRPRHPQPRGRAPRRCPGSAGEVGSALHVERAREPVPGPRRRLLPHRSQRHRATAPARPNGKRAKKALAERVEELDDLSRCLYAHDKIALLCIFQAMDAAGKDGAIRAVFTRRRSRRRRGPLLQAALAGRARPRLPVAHHAAPAAARPHRRLQPQLLRRGAGGARAPRDPRRRRSCRGEPRAPRLWEERLDVDPRARAPPGRERHRGPQVLPQRLARGAAPALPGPARRAAARTGSSPSSDVRESERWDDYMKAYEAALNATSRPWAPWYAIPADDKPFARLCVAEIVADDAAVARAALSRARRRRGGEVRRAAQHARAGTEGEEATKKPAKRK